MKHTLKIKISFLVLLLSLSISIQSNSFIERNFDNHGNSNSDTIEEKNSKKSTFTNKNRNELGNSNSYGITSVINRQATNNLAIISKEISKSSNLRNRRYNDSNIDLENPVININLSQNSSYEKENTYKDSIQTKYRKSHNSYLQLMKSISKNRNDINKKYSKYITTEWKERNLATSCASGLYLEEGYCVPWCVQFYHGIVGNECKTCPSGTVANPVTKKCESESTCESYPSAVVIEYTSTGALYCRCCNSGDLYFRGSSCESDCLPGYYLQDEYNVCKTCPDSLTSSGIKKTKNKEDVCVEACPTNWGIIYFGNNNYMSCQPCPTNKPKWVEEICYAHCYDASIYKEKIPSSNLCQDCLYNLRSNSNDECDCFAEKPLRLDGENCYATCPAGSLKNTSTTCITCSLKIY